MGPSLRLRHGPQSNSNNNSRMSSSNPPPPKRAAKKEQPAATSRGSKAAKAAAAAAPAAPEVAVTIAAEIVVWTGEEQMEDDGGGEDDGVSVASSGDLSSVPDSPLSLMDELAGETPGLGDGRGMRGFGGVSDELPLESEMEKEEGLMKGEGERWVKAESGGEVGGKTEMEKQVVVEEQSVSEEQSVVEQQEEVEDQPVVDAEPVVDEEPLMDWEPLVEGEQLVEEEPQVEEERKIEDEQRIDEEPQIEGEPQIESGSRIEDQPQTKDQPQIDDEPRNEDARMEEDEPEQTTEQMDDQEPESLPEMEPEKAASPSPAPKPQQNSPPPSVTAPQPEPAPNPSSSLSSLSSLSSAPVLEHKPSFLSSLSVTTDPSDAFSNAPSLSSKATTPIDLDTSKETHSSLPQPVAQPSTAPRRRWDIRPKVSIPTDLPLAEYAMQCIAAAEASRLNPYHLHKEEYLMLRDHISHTQVTTYLNIRNGILRLWVRNPQIAVTLEEAVGCAKDARWFDVASVCFDWLVRRGFINFGCVEIRSSRKHSNKDSPSGRKRKTVVVIGAGMSGLGCARQLEGLFLQYSKKFRELGEDPPRVVVLEGRNRIGGRVYSKAFQSRPKNPPEGFDGMRYTAEMGGMIITGFDRGNPLNILLRGQLGLPYRALRPDTTLYDSNGKPVDLVRDQLVENLYNDCLDRVSEYKFKHPSSKLIEGNRDLMDEGRDSSAETHKTIRQAEEAAAAQPHAAPVSEQNIAPQVNLIPISTDRATGRIHTEPGTPGALKAARKAKLMGWTLKQGVSEDADLNIQSATLEPGATLGTVTDNVISQYKDIVDLNPHDYRLMNWHVANLEYSNATNYHQLSLQGWDIDAGNEWEGSHTMVVGGYQSVPRGLLSLPTKLDLRQKSPVNKITYTPEGQTGPATVECEDGFKIEADFVVNTIPLGVLKHGGIQFEPPLPSWKADAISRLGFGVLNKVILVYKTPFWDQDRDIFGVLRNPTNRNSLDQKDYASQRGRFFQWFNISQTSGLPVLLALMAGDAGYDTEQTCNDDLVAEATSILRSVYGPRVPEPVETVVTRWASDKFARGSYSSAGPDMKADDYDAMARPLGRNLFFAGEHTTGTHPATVHGAYLSGLRAAAEVLDAMLGPIQVPVPLVLPKAYSLKRRAAASLAADPVRARQEAYDNELWDFVVSQIGVRPPAPSKPASNAYIFYSKAHYDDAKRRLEEGRRAGKGKASANEVRVMSAKMWRDLGEEARRPYVEMAEVAKQRHAEVMAGFRERAAEWDAKATELKARFEGEHPPPPPGLGGEEEGGRRAKKRAVERIYAESEASLGDGDVEMAGV